MNRILTISAAALCLTYSAATLLAQDNSAPIPDVLKSAVDPLNPGTERAKFLKAAGVDTELDETEFKANLKLDDGFVRQFDKWSNLTLFDKNKDKKIDWFEANAYRRAIRTAVLGTYDADKNRKLTGEERVKANKDLAAGKLPRISAPSATTAPQSNLGTGAQPQRPSTNTRGDRNRSDDPARSARRQEWEKLQTELVKKHDADGNGRINGEEWRAARDDIRAYYRKREIERYDANGDGEVSDEERRAGRDKERAAELKRRHDRDGDGQLNSEEQAAYDKDLQESRDRRAFDDERRKAFMSRFDKDGDGDLNEEERNAIRPYFEKRREETTKVALERFDKDGNGELSREERQAGYEAIQKEQLNKWDKNGDGELSSAERLEAYRNREDGAVSNYGLMRVLGGDRRRGGRGSRGSGGRGPGGGQRSN